MTGEHGTVPSAMLAALPGARSVCVRDAGHDAHLDAPAAFADALLAFIAAGGGSGR